MLPAGCDHPQLLTFPLSLPQVLTLAVLYRDSWVLFPEQTGNFISSTVQLQPNSFNLFAGQLTGPTLPF